MDIETYVLIILHKEKLPYYLHTYLLIDDKGNTEEVQSINLFEEGDVILDPMSGSGTTCKMAQKNNRHFIGIDISQEYCDIANERLRQGVLL